MSLRTVAIMCHLTADQKDIGFIGCIWITGSYGGINIGAFKDSYDLMIYLAQVAENNWPG